jgi:endonuclease-3
MKKNDIAPFFAALKAANPTPQTELEYTTVFELLTAVLLSAQATDVGVNKATRRLFLLPTLRRPFWIWGLRAGELHQDHRPVPQQGQASDGDLPHAGSAAWRHGTPNPRRAGSPSRCGPQDRQCGAQRGFRPAHHGRGHAHLPRRQPHGAGPGKNPLEVEKQLLKRVPDEYAVDSHHWLILLGRYVCQARKPRCWECVASQYCDFTPKTPAPATGKKS